MTLLLNLGAGQKPVEASEGLSVINHDRTKHSESVDIAWNLDNLPWPWDSDTFDHIYAWAVLEHLQHDLVASFNECWRILKVGGRLDVKLPHWHHEESHIDPTHRWFAALQTFDHFDPATDRGSRFGFYAGGVRPWKIIESGYTAEGASVYARLDKLED